MITIALVAHDKKKPKMLEFVKKHSHFLSSHHLISTATTGKLIQENTDLKVETFLSGPKGGDQQIGAQISMGHVALVCFFRDPLTAQPHEPDITALLRICDVHSIPLATYIGTGDLLLKGLSMQISLGKEQNTNSD